MRLSNIAHLYVVRLKARVALVQELLAVLGIAVGVALLFASQVASTSLDASVSQLTSGVVGQSEYQLKARSQEGFSETLLSEVKDLPGVLSAVPVLETHATVTGPHGSQPVDLIATDPHDVHLAGRLLRRFAGAQLVSKRVLALPAPIADKIGVGSLEAVRLQVGPKIVHAFVGLELTAENVGPLSNSPIVLAPLAYAQKLADAQGRITRVLVQVRPGDKRAVHAGLVRLAAGTINVEPATFDATLFSQAAGPINQTTILFSTICALVGFMFAYCSMLLTSNMRQSLIGDLRRNGTTRWGVVKALIFDALVLGAVASLLGLIMGRILAAAVFGTNPGYLSFGFPIGSVQIVTFHSVVIAVGAGMLAACVGVLTPLRITAMRVSHKQAGKRSTFGGWKGGMLAGGLACLGITTVILLTGVQSVRLAIIGIISLIVALLLLLPSLIDLTTDAFDRLQKRVGGGSTEIAVLELRSPLTRSRSIAIAATGALAVFGSVAIQGGGANLQGGLDRLFQNVSGVTDLWIVPPGGQDLLTTNAFRGVPMASLTNLPGVRAVGEYRAGFLEYGRRRVWVLAPPSTTPSPLPSSQLIAGNVALADTRLREGGWAVISKTLATVHHLHIGQAFVLPSPHETTFRVAAFTTNLGWPPGAIILNGADYAHAWGSSDPSAYNVMLTPSASPGQVRRELQRALGPQSGLIVQTAREHEQDQRSASRKGLGRLTQISRLVLIAAVFAMAIAMGALVWQRRRKFARMKVQGYERQTLWKALICESMLLLGTGCLIGSMAGVYSEILQSHALVAVTGFPIVISIHVLAAFGSFVVVTVAAAAIIAVPGYRAADIAPYPWSDS